MSNVRDWKLNKETSKIPENEKWDCCPRPYEDEAFLSWFTRLAKENYSDVDLLYHKFRETNYLRNMNQEKLDKVIITLETNNNKRKELVEALSPFIHLDSKIQSRLEKGLIRVPPSKNHWNYLITPLSSPRICPDCLKRDQIPYIRYFWYLRFYTICPIHKCLLIDVCPHCYLPIFFWKTKWNQSMITCFYCGEEITQNLIFTSILDKQISIEFQEKYLECYKSGKYNDRKIEPIYFFQQIMKLMVIESKDEEVKRYPSDEKPLSTGKVLKGLLLSSKILENDFERLERPYICEKDDLKFRSELELELHVKTIHSPEYIISKIEDEETKVRYEIIAPLLEIEHRTSKDVINRAKQFGLSLSILYRWIRSYESEGILGLTSKKHKRGNRQKKISDEVEEIIYKHIRHKCECCRESDIFQVKVLNIRKECKELGIKPPSGEPVARRLRVMTGNDNSVTN